MAWVEYRGGGAVRLEYRVYGGVGSEWSISCTWYTACNTTIRYHGILSSVKSYCACWNFLLSDALRGRLHRLTAVSPVLAAAPASPMLAQDGAAAAASSSLLSSAGSNETVAGFSRVLLPGIYCCTLFVVTDLNLGSFTCALICICEAYLFWVHIDIMLS